MFDKKKASKRAVAVEGQLEGGTSPAPMLSDRPVANMDDLLLAPLENSAGDKITIREEDMLVNKACNYFYADEQVRKTFDKHEIEEMAASLRANGQIQPIVVYPVDSNGRYKIDKGECRWRAAQLIEGFTLKAVIDPGAKNRNNKKRIITQLVENDQRNDVPPLDMAIALKALVDEGMLLDDIARELGWLTQSNKKPNGNKVSRILSILKLPKAGQALVSDGIVTDLITLEFIRKIHDINPDKFSVVCDLAREAGGITRKRAEQEFKQCKSNEAGPKAKKSPDGKGKPEANNGVEIGKHQSTHPVIKIDWCGVKTGTLVLSKKPTDESKCFILLESGDEIESDLDDVKLLSIDLGQ